MFGVAELSFFWFDADGDRIVATVITALHFDDFHAAGDRAREPERMHGDFGAAAAEANHLHREAFTNEIGEFEFHTVRHAEKSANFKAFRDGFRHGGMAVAGKEGTVTKVVIDVFVTIDVVNASALAILHKKRIGRIKAVVAADAYGNASTGASVRVVRHGRAPFIVC